MVCGRGTRWGAAECGWPGGAQALRDARQTRPRRHAARGAAPACGQRVGGRRARGGARARAARGRGGRPPRAAAASAANSGASGRAAPRRAPAARSGGRRARRARRAQPRGRPPPHGRPAGPLRSLPSLLRVPAGRTPGEESGGRGGGPFPGGDPVRPRLAPSAPQLLASVTGGTPSPNAILLVAGIAKLFVAELVEAAASAAAERGDAGPLRPAHFRAAYAALEAGGRVPGVRPPRRGRVRL